MRGVVPWISFVINIPPRCVLGTIHMKQDSWVVHVVINMMVGDLTSSYVWDLLMIHLINVVHVEVWVSVCVVFHAQASEGSNPVI